MRRVSEPTGSGSQTTLLGDHPRPRASPAGMGFMGYEYR